MKTETHYQGLYDTGDGRKGWFNIDENIYQAFLRGEKMLCQNVRIEPDDFDFSKVELPSTTPTQKVKD